YCNKEVDALIDKQSEELDVEKRKQIVRAIERRLAEVLARPITQHQRMATCGQPHVKGFVLHRNSIYNDWRYEDVWLDKYGGAGSPGMGRDCEWGVYGP